MVFTFNADSFFTPVLNLWALHKIPPHTGASHPLPQACRSRKVTQERLQCSTTHHQKISRPTLGCPLLCRPPAACRAKLATQALRELLSMPHYLGRVGSQGVMKVVHKSSDFTRLIYSLIWAWNDGFDMRYMAPSCRLHVK